MVNHRIQTSNFLTDYLFHRMANLLF